MSSSSSVGVSSFLNQPASTMTWQGEQAGERALARALDIDPVLVGDLKHRQTDRCVNLATCPVALDKCHLRHWRLSTSACGSGPVAGSKVQRTGVRWAGGHGSAD